MIQKFVRCEQKGAEFWGIFDEGTKRVNRISAAPYGRWELVGIECGQSELRLLAPVTPEKIVLVGLNYAKHVQASQSANEVPDEPVIFLKPPTAIIGPEATIIYPAGIDRVDYEAELGLVIGKTLKNASPDEAANGIFGLTCVNDVTARKLQKKDGQWTRAKGFDTFCPVGPWIVTGLDWSDLKVESFLNGQLKQSGRTSEMIFKPSVLVSFISRVMTLKPGDLISTGTPEGIDPMQVGDKIEIVIAGVGTLTNYVGV